MPLSQQCHVQRIALYTQLLGVNASTAPRDKRHTTPKLYVLHRVHRARLRITLALDGGHTLFTLMPGLYNVRLQKGKAFKASKALRAVLQHHLQLALQFLGSPPT